jgi:hypothetical protein
MLAASAAGLCKDEMLQYFGRSLGSNEASCSSEDETQGSAVASDGNGTPGRLG